MPVCHSMTSQSRVQETLSLVRDEMPTSCHSTSPPCRPGRGRRVPCATDMWAVPLQLRNSYHVDFSNGMHRTVVKSAAGTTKPVRKEYAHTLTSSLPRSPSLNALNQFAHMHIHTGHPGGEICELWGSAEPLSRAVAIKQKHL